MSKQDLPIKNINSVSEVHRLLSLPAPKNPLITLINHAHEPPASAGGIHRMLLNFYNISIKRSFQGQLRYGRNYYDFDNGTMTFSAPGQIIAVDQGDERDNDGWSLMFHPDLIRNYPLGKSIKNYGFFAYDVNEALHLSDEEEKLIESLVRNIQNEYESRIDNFSADVIVSNLDLLLNYCNRFYNRQFVTRKMANNDLLAKFEKKLADHFEESSATGLITVNNLAEGLNVSASYLSDMLRATTGQNTQQHIHNKLIEKAKDILANTDLSVSEIAFRLGFEFPQSFNKLFKNKTSMSPLEFRQSFN
ncbi:AraC family transcriptional regulator [Mucilaginibacter galii]|uniref:AraC family transcriptional regulator n=1 Tax=Mucilaginibacter galii TaxID=2005073 RepID=A0A917J9S8_9SPHI|nr:helix-turn-helix transcriptional regulator [Mucilaginibacter galii]GGI51730.1 AraC family transcriptional regulator [Mucilaginibacter galii]